MLSSVDLPHPLGPTMATNSPARDRQVDLVERVTLSPRAESKRFRHAGNGDLRRHRHASEKPRRHGSSQRSSQRVARSISRPITPMVSMPTMIASVRSTSR